MCLASTQYFILLTSELDTLSLFYRAICKMYELLNSQRLLSDNIFRNGFYDRQRDLNVMDRFQSNISKTIFSCIQRIKIFTNHII